MDDGDLGSLLVLLRHDCGTPLERMERAQWVVRTAEDEMRSVIREARALGDSWATIGAALGMTRQAVQERFGRDTDPGR